MWCALKEPDRALADCDQAIRLEPHALDGHVCRGLALALNGEFAAAFGEWVFHPIRPSQVKIKFGSP